MKIKDIDLRYGNNKKIEISIEKVYGTAFKLSTNLPNNSLFDIEVYVNNILNRKFFDINNNEIFAVNLEEQTTYNIKIKFENFYSNSLVGTTGLININNILGSDFMYFPFDDASGNFKDLSKGAEIEPKLFIGIFDDSAFTRQIDTIIDKGVEINNVNLNTLNPSDINNFFTPNKFSVSGWFYAFQSTQSQILFTDSGDINSRPGDANLDRFFKRHRVQLLVNGDGTLICTFSDLILGNNLGRIESKEKIKLNSWNHFIITSDASDNVTLYLNSFQGTKYNFINPPIEETDNILEFFVRKDQVNFAFPFNGKIDDFYFMNNKILDLGETSDFYNNRNKINI